MDLECDGSGKTNADQNDTCNNYVTPNKINNIKTKKYMQNTKKERVYVKQGVKLRSQ